MPPIELRVNAVEHALRERIKELTCLYGVARLAERPAQPLPDFLEGVVRLLPAAWQFPEVTHATIEFRGRRFACGATAPKPHDARQSAAIRMGPDTMGAVRIHYTQPRPDSFEGPFLREERALLDAVADYVATIAARIETEAKLVEANRLLRVEREALREVNTTLRTVLSRIGEEKRELCRDIQANVEKVILPVVQAISLELPPAKSAYASLLRNSLLDVTSPLTRELGRDAPPLTPTETAICAMIRNGLRTKEIARLRGLSPATVNRHREHIRNKLGLANRPMNLTTWLHNLSLDELQSARNPAPDGEVKTFQPL